MMCEKCGFEGSDGSRVNEIFREACVKRGLDPAVMPPEAEHLLAALQVLVGMIGVTAADNPGIMQWFAAGLESFANIADRHAEAVFSDIAALILGKRG